MNWFIKLLLEESIPQTVIIFGVVIAIGTWLGRVKIFGISLGVTWILFMGLAISYAGIHVNKETEHFLKEFGLILFVYSIGLQVGPGFFSSLKKNAAVTNGLAAMVVLLGVLTVVGFYFLLGQPITTLTGVMSGAVTNTPGLGAAQAAAKDLHLPADTTSFITLAYAVVYPFGVFGIIAAILILKAFFRVNLDKERELHRKLDVLKSNKPVSIHLVMQNKQLVGKPLRNVFELLKEPVVVSRLYHQGKVITPTPQTHLAEDDVLLIVAHKDQLQVLKTIIGEESDMNLKELPKSELISRIIIVTQSEVTHRRLGDIAALHQHDFTLTRLSRAGVEMVPHGDIVLQLGDQVKVVGTEEGIDLVTKTVGNQLKRLDVPDLAPIFIGIVAGVVLGSVPMFFFNMPVPVKIGLAGGPLIIALLLSRYGGKFYLNQYTTYSANLMLRELGISLFLASVGLSSGANLQTALSGNNAWLWIVMGLTITIVPLLIVGMIAHYVFRKTFFEVCGLLSGASTDPPALAFSTQLAKNEVASVTYATVYPLTMILRIIAAQLLILFLS
ncbi:putative transporter [Lacibacter luteus]|uniref:Putative transporter n=1 Tax=Lacibacter luteus TaxID=2508719 RepID=A0A4Q1CJR2_9BACT|nr:putative transporter [Lacibacter luteus]RXK60617.1 putative transporter [Lacibacter luteus]